MSEPSQAIVIDSVVKTYKSGKVKALNGISFSVGAGEAVGIIGPNGAGKTTLFGCLLGFLRPDAGTISINGMPPDFLAVRRILGFLPERLDFDRWMTGFDFMSFQYSLAKLPENSRKSEVEKLLTLVDLDPNSWRRPLGKYSRGMLQRLGLAQSLIGNPRFLLLDEPVSGVDPGGVVLFRKILRDLKSEGVTILLNSHQLEQVERICDRAVFIKVGKIEAIEELAGTAGGVIEVRWKPIEHEEQIVAYKHVIDKQTIAKTIDCSNASAHFLTESVDQTANLIKHLVCSDIPVIQVTSAEKNLERLFTHELPEAASVTSTEEETST